MIYRVIASVDAYHHIDVEAPNALAAREIAERTDLDNWNPETLVGSGWTIWEIEPIIENAS